MKDRQSLALASNREAWDEGASAEVCAADSPPEKFQHIAVFLHR